MKANNFNCYDFFSGYVPAGIIFQMSAYDIVTLAKENIEKDHSCINELCLIGLVSYFEAFTKDHLSSVLSIAPVLIQKVREAGYITDIPAEEAYEFRDSLKYKIGFLIGQRLDFGSAKKINSIFTSVLKITPFNKTKAAHYDRLLRDRNLIVHHGGIYTTSYIKQAFKEINPQLRRAHADSIEIDCNKIIESADLLKSVARSTIEASANKLQTVLQTEGSLMTKEIKDAIDAMRWWEE